MEEKKDIGSFFKDELKNGKKSPDNDLWDRISTSLDEENPVRKSSLRYWVLGLGIPFLIGLVLLFYPSELAENDSEILVRDNTTELPYSIIEKPSEIKDGKAISLDSLENIENLKRNPIEIATDIEDLTKKTEQNSAEITAENKTKQSSPKTPSGDEKFTVSKKYHYYNSEDGAEWTTTDKNKIDSLLTRGTRVLDSITTIKKDSLIE